MGAAHRAGPGGKDARTRRGMSAERWAARGVSSGTDQARARLTWGPERLARDKLRRSEETTLQGWGHQSCGPGEYLGKLSKDAVRGRNWTQSPPGFTPAWGSYRWKT